MKLKLYKKYKKLLLLLLFILFICICFKSNLKEGWKIKNAFKWSPPPIKQWNPWTYIPIPIPPPRCYGCDYYDSASRSCRTRCRSSQRCENGQCVCPRGYYWNGSYCTTCPRGQYWNGSSCVCPSGQNWNGSSCITCKEGQIWQNNQCVCQPHQKLKADGTACTDICEKTTVWNGTNCVCPEGKKWVVGVNESGCK